jgi:hypothetical protein
MFPFKLEIEEAIFSFYSNNLDSHNTTGSRSIVPIFAIYLMYIQGDMAGEVRQLAEKHKLKHYLIDIPAGVVEYIKSLPETHYNMQMFEKEEYEILNEIGFNVSGVNYFKDVQEHIIKYIKKNYPQYYVYNVNLGCYI